MYDFVPLNTVFLLLNERYFSIGHPVSLVFPWANSRSAGPRTLFTHGSLTFLVTLVNSSGPGPASLPPRLASRPAQNCTVCGNPPFGGRHPCSMLQPGNLQAVVPL